MHKDTEAIAVSAQVGNRLAQTSCDPNPLREQYNKMHKDTESVAAQRNSFA